MHINFNTIGLANLTLTSIQLDLQTLTSIQLDLQTLRVVCKVVEKHVVKTITNCPTEQR